MSLVADPDRLAIVLGPAEAGLGRQRAPGLSRHHLGFYESELLRRVDPKHRTWAGSSRREIATPLGVDFYLRLAGGDPDSRLAPLQRFSMAARDLRCPRR